MMMKRLIDLKIEKLVYEGYGLGHNAEGKTIFVRKAIPGDEIKAEITVDKKNFAFASINAITKPSPQRIAPICPHFMQCGGCDYQNMSYSDQLKQKEQIFREIFERAKLQTDILPIISGAGDNTYHYRNSMRYFGTRTKDGKFAFGMHDAIDPGELVPIHSCFLLSPEANDLMEKLTIELNKEKKVPAIELRIRETKEPLAQMVELITKDDFLPRKDALIEVLRSIPAVISAYHTISNERTLHTAKRKLLFGAPVLIEKIGRFSFYVSPQSFFQTNTLGIKTLYDMIKGFADPSPQDTILDLYCGTGTIGIYLSTLAKKVIGVENVPEAVNDARGNAKLNNVCNCDFYCSDVTQFLLSLPTTNHPLPTTIILDPPRTGLTKSIIHLLSHLVLSHFHTKVIYVSCNPTTFVRDCLTFEELGWKLTKVQPIDMFPQTHHIECVGLLSKKNE